MEVLTGKKLPIKRYFRESSMTHDLTCSLFEIVLDKYVFAIRRLDGIEVKADMKCKYR